MTMPVFYIDYLTKEQFFLNSIPLAGIYVLCNLKYLFSAALKDNKTPKYFLSALWNGGQCCSDAQAK